MDAPVIDTRPIVAAGPKAPAHGIKVRTRDVSVFYGDKQALSDVSLDMADRGPEAQEAREKAKMLGYQG